VGWNGPLCAARCEGANLDKASADDAPPSHRNSSRRLAFIRPLSILGQILVDQRKDVSRVPSSASPAPLSLGPDQEASNVVVASGLIGGSDQTRAETLKRQVEAEQGFEQRVGELSSEPVGAK